MNAQIASLLSLLLVFLATSPSGICQGKSWKSDGSGTKTWGNGNSWKDEEDPETTGVPDNGDTATIEAGVLEIDNLRGLGYLKMIGGNLRGVSGVDFDTLELQGNSAHYEWFNGSIRQLKLLISSGAFLDVANTSVNDFTGSQIENSGTFTWTSGNLTTDATGGITNNVGALFADANPSDVSIGSSGATFDNYGTYEKTGAGTTTVTQTFNNYSSETLEVSNGIFEIAGGGTNIDGAVMRVTNSGLIVFKSSPYTIVNAANLEVGNSENENKLDGSQYFTLPTGEQINFGYELSSSTLTLGSVEGSSLNVAFLQSGGTLAGTHVIADDYFLENGDLNSSGTTTIASGGSLTFADAGTNYFRYRTIINDGTINWTDGSLAGGSGSSITNNGTFKDTADTRFYNYIGGAHSFTNSATGTYNKNGPGTTEFDSPFNNQGTVNVNAGTLKLDGGGTNSTGAKIDADSGATVQFDSDYTIEDGSDLAGNGTVELTYGLLDIAGEIAVKILQKGGDIDGNFDIAGTFDWDDGLWNAAVAETSTTIKPTGTLNIDESTAYFRGRDIINNGTVNWIAGTLLTDSEGSFTNSGTFNDQSADGDDISEYSGSSVFTNNGTFLKTSTGSTRIDLQFNNTSPKTLDVRNGSLELNGGGTNLGGAAVVVKNDGLIRFTDNCTIVQAEDLTTESLSGQFGYELAGGELDLNGQLNANLLQTGGELEGTHTIAGTFTLEGGDWDANSDGATTTIASTGVVNIDPTGSQNPDYDNRDIINYGTFNWKHGDLDTTSAGSFTNYGNFNDQTDHDHEIGGTSGVATFTNAASGTFTKSGNSHTRIYQDFDNAGTLVIQDGRIVLKDAVTFAATSDVQISSGGDLEIEDNTSIATGAKFSGDGTFVVDSGILTGQTDFNVDFVQDGGTLDGDFNFYNGYTFNDGTSAPNGGDINLNSGTFTLNDSVSLGQHAGAFGGTLAGTHTISGRLEVDGAVFDSSGTTTIASDGAVEFGNIEDNPLDRSFVNNGKILWIDGDMTGSGENSLTNNGEFAVSVDGTFGSAADDFSIQNDGKFIKTGGTGTTTIDVPFTNNGTIAAETGQFHFTDNLTFGANATLGGGVQFDAPVSLSSSSTLAGNGTIMGSITTGGTVSPGNSIGSLSITGDLTLLSSSNSFFEVSGSTDPASSDTVSVSGTLTLAGTLSWNLLASLDPVQTDVFTLYSASSLTGTFENVANGGRLFNSDKNRSFVVNYGPSSAFDVNSVVFSNFTFTPIPEPSTWALMALALGLVGMRITRRPRRS